MGYSNEYKKDKVRDIFLKFLINYCKFEVFPFFKEKYFYDLFVRFMYYLQSIRNKWYYLSPLISFEMETNSIELEDGVIIRRIKPEEFLAMNEKYSQSFDSFNRKYVIELCSEVVSDTNQSFFCEDQINFVLGSLRLFKKGAVDTILIVGGIDDDKWILGTQVAMIFNTHKIPKPVVYRLNKNEVIGLKKFYKQYKNSPIAERLRNGVKRFSSAIKEKDPDDKIIDFVIALESLFSDGQSEMTYKLKVRIAFLIGTTEDKANYLYEFVGKAYTARSKIVHGGVEKWKFIINDKHLEKEEVVAQLEETTRLAMKRILNMTRNYNVKVDSDITKHIDRLMINGKKPRLKVNPPLKNLLQAL